ncbi:BQ5605_C008g05349 [Microbotryum silenes-dioicae]|uniref:BQ5605_C008g05349 protein n=1 Tax=Microbotryum silenes-dioicae TaxID=796604 RepID=A0A2X0PEG2_9BASI|nr:BQ5605_C008g05349 [Microbotryum silenes-dioicae]
MTSFLRRISSRGSSDALPSLNVSSHDSDDDRESSRSRGRSLSPFRRRRSTSKTRAGTSAGSSKRSPSAEGLRTDPDHESDAEGDRTPVVRPSNAFDSDSEDEDEDEGEDWPEEVLNNTEANSSTQTPEDFITREGLSMTFPGEGPNIDSSQSSAGSGPGLLRRKSTKSAGKTLQPLKLETGRPVFEKNRCSITLTQGDPIKAGEGRRTRSFLVASDLSDESLYAIEWAIGTVLREGDECTIVSIIETDSKFDPESTNLSSSEKKAKIINQRERQASCLAISRQATALLEKTSLNVSIYCQAIHAKVPRHLLVDLIDYVEPTMVIIGTRGLSKIKGMLLGSVSNYLLQKSSCPVMVVRRPLRLSRTTHRKLSSLNREARRPLSEAIIESESRGGTVGDDADEPEDVKEKVKCMSISDK